MGHWELHTDVKNKELKSIFLPPYNNKKFNQHFVRKNVKQLQQWGILKDRFIHQVDEQDFKFGCWRVHIPTDTAAGYYIGEDGQKHYQYFITIWITYSGILSVYPSDGQDDKNRKLRFQPKNSGKGQILTMFPLNTIIFTNSYLINFSTIIFSLHLLTDHVI